MKRSHSFPWLLLSGILCAANFASAQPDMNAAIADAEARSSKSVPKTETSPSEEKSIEMPASASEVILEHPETRVRYLTAMQGYYKYMADGYAYRSRVFEWQLLSSRLIFIVVLTLVGAGLYFAAVQFRIAMRVATRKIDAALPSGQDPGVSLATQIEVGAKGVVVNSSVLGVIILALSLAFFYLYLVHVYPITNVF